MTDTELLKQVTSVLSQISQILAGSVDPRGSWSSPQLGPDQRHARRDGGRQLLEDQHLLQASQLHAVCHRQRQEGRGGGC